MADGSSRGLSRRAFGRSCASAFAVCVGAALAVTACDERFEPTAPTELAFSVFGYLDASADTQWIRVMPIRPLKVTSPDASGATVTLEHLETGRVVALQDSLFRFVTPGDPWGEGEYLHNFWTLEDVEPGASYRFSATRDGKEPSEATVTIPHDFDVEVAISQIQSRWNTIPDEVRITGAPHLPFLATIAHFRDSCGSGVDSVPYSPHSADDATYVIPITKVAIEPRVVAGQPGEPAVECGEPWVANHELWMAASEADWPSGGYSQYGLGASGRTSNVSNAVGFLGGILTKVVPYEACRFESHGAAIPTYCLLRYTGETATVRGTVREPLCAGPLDSVVVQMTEVGEDPARVRNTLTDGAGGFVLGALEPGIPHALWVRAPPVPTDSAWDLRSWRWVYTEWADIHTLHRDTLTFVPGQQVDYDITLQRLIPCDQRLPVLR